MTTDKPLLIEAGDVTIDATGIYDTDGRLVCVEINGLPIRVEEVAWALDVLAPGAAGTAWQGPIETPATRAVDARDWAHDRAAYRSAAR